MKHRRYFRRTFTLMEVVVAMAVFSVMMTILLDFFVRTQDLWSKTDSRSELYADARVAMNLFASTLQSQYFDSGNTVFLFGQSSGKCDAMFFPVKMPVGFGRTDEMYMYYVSLIWRPADATLYWRSFGESDGKEAYKNLFSPHTEYSVSSKKTLLRGSACLGYDADKSEKVIDGVLSLSFKPVLSKPGTGIVFLADSDVSDSISKSSASWNPAQQPFAVQINMQMLGKRHFKQWQDLGGAMNASGIDTAAESDAAKEFRQANTYQFSRIIYLGF